MGKNKVTKTLGSRIGNVVLHELIGRHTNRPESRNFLHNEELVYRDGAIKDAKKYHWNEEDKKALRAMAFDFVKFMWNKKYPDVKLVLTEAENLIDKEISDLSL